MKHRIFMLFIITIGISSCMKDRDNLYKSATVIEFVPITASVKKGTIATPGNAIATVQLVGPQVSTATELDYEVATTSTGIQGTDYSIAGIAGKITIPANSSSANISITALPSTFPTTGSKTVILTLKGNSTIAPSANYKTYTLTITQ